MESLKAIGTTTKNTIVSEFFPGIIATWPIILYGLKWYTDIGKTEIGLDGKSLSNWEIVVSLLLLICLYGIGHGISKLGARLEVKLDELVIRKNQKILNSISTHEKKQNFSLKHTHSYFNDKQFTKVWYKYLRIAFKEDYKPTLVRYYSGFINAFKFELNMICAIVIMNITLSSIENDGWIRKCIKGSGQNNNSSLDLFSPGTYLLVSISSVILILYFYYESRMAIYEQHNLRKQFIKANKKISKMKH